MSEAALTPGTLLSDGRTNERGFRVLRVLGAGGFGITYLAEWLRFGVPVAIKEYLPDGLAWRAADGITVEHGRASAAEQYRYGLSCFETEARTVLQFKHPSIVRVLNFFEANNTLYTVMDYEEGRTLAQLIRERGPIPQQEMLVLARQILDALAVVHAKGYLHRDIKPSNLVVRADGTPVLIDFGSARQALGQEAKSLSVFLTPGYAPFEQLLPRGHQGPWSDIYALGATLYCCMAGDFSVAETPAHSRDADVREGRADPLPSVRARARLAYSEPVLQAVDCMLQVEPRRRPQNIDAVRTALFASDMQVSSSSGDANSGVASIALEPRAEVREDAETQRRDVPPEKVAAALPLSGTVQVDPPNRRRGLQLTLGVLVLLLVLVFTLSQRTVESPQTSPADAQTTVPRMDERDAAKDAVTPPTEESDPVLTVSAPKPSGQTDAARPRSQPSYWNGHWHMRVPGDSLEQVCRDIVKYPELVSASVWRCLEDGKFRYEARIGPTDDRSTIDPLRQQLLGKGVFSVMLKVEGCEALEQAEC